MLEMPIFYINLAARVDRRDAIEARFAVLGLSAQRIEATTPHEIRQSDLDRYCDPHRHFWLTPPELACGLSHVTALHAFLATDAPYAAIFEDDVLLSDALPAFLINLSASGQFARNLIKLETFDEPLLIDPRPSEMIGSIALRQVYSQSNGSAGYVVSRAAAALIANSTHIRATQADSALFNPHRYLARHLIVRHTDPGLCIQQHRWESERLDSIDSQITVSREARRVTARRYRLHRDMRKLTEFLETSFWFAPRELFAKLSMRAHQQRIPFATDAKRPKKTDDAVTVGAQYDGKTDQLRIAILKDWPGTDLARQWPTNPPADIANVQFQINHTQQADFVVALNRPQKDTWVECSPNKVWALVQEPPTPRHIRYHDGQRAFSRVYTTDSHYQDSKHIQFFGALEWHVGKSYDELAATQYPAKSGTLSWITSDATVLRGQRIRMQFLERLRQTSLPLDLYGRGLTPIDDKWDGIAPYRYSIAFENFADDLYWSEKLTDCFLGYATPFYFGTATIDRYFPKGSYVSIDPDDPHVFRKMQEKIDQQFHESNLEALREARDLCLNKYNTLFFIAREAVAYADNPSPPPQRILLRHLRGEASLPRRMAMYLRRPRARSLPNS